MGTMRSSPARINPSFPSSSILLLAPIRVAWGDNPAGLTYTDVIDARMVMIRVHSKGACAAGGGAFTPRFAFTHIAFVPRLD